MGFRLVVEEFEGKPCSWNMDSDTLADAKAMLDLLTWNRDTDLRRQIKAELRTDKGLIVYRLTFLKETRTYWLQFSPDGK